MKNNNEKQQQLTFNLHKDFVFLFHWFLKQFITYQVISRLVLVFMPNDSILAKLYFELRGPVGLVTAVGFESTLCPNGAHNALRFKLNLKI